MKFSTLALPLLAAQAMATAIPSENIDNSLNIDLKDKPKETSQGICSRKYHYGVSRNKFLICGSKTWGDNGAALLKEIDHKRIHIHKIENGHGNGCDWWVKFQASVHWLDKYFEHAIRDAGGPKDAECKEVKDWDDVGED
ncbi:hypothetical protein HII31_04824 [Pseudocercospora fuligena]|uniref:Uncharacterized protein n=1 Tax=Pseudocercospora fuligena TaxID=685502 RepID=A0A8H6VMU5_9PEZI|nr:hypothetical protein HII31_04824 [Pseudocercospora fuligena]